MYIHPGKYVGVLLLGFVVASKFLT
jgi:hypothetical protein